MAGFCQLEMWSRYGRGGHHIHFVNVFPPESNILTDQKSKNHFFDLLQTFRKSYTVEGNQFALRCADTILGWRLEKKKLGHEN